MMSSGQRRWVLWSEVLGAWLILLLLVFYTYVEFVVAPYVGFHFDPITGEIQSVFNQPPSFPLARGDQIVAVNGVPFTSYEDDLHAHLFPNPDSAEPLVMEIENATGRHMVNLPVADFNEREFEARLQNSFWIGLLFWITGGATLLLVRPLDTKRRLFAAFFLLTAMWLVVGNTSRWGYFESRVVYRLALWFSVPVLLHLHWLFPRPLGKLPRWLVIGIYGATVVMAVLQWTQQIDKGAAALAYAVALLGSLLLLVVHYVRQPDVRAQIRLLFVALVVAILPVAALSLSFAMDTMPRGATYSLIALPLIPGAYFYSIYRFQLGGSEFRANRLIAVYLYFILLGTLLPIAVNFLATQPAFAGGTLLLSTVVGLAVALLTIYGFPHFQRLVERRLLAMPLPPLHLIDTYLARITTTLSDASLVTLLKYDVLPTLMIRESALLRVSNQEINVLYSTDNLTRTVTEPVTEPGTGGGAADAAPHPTGSILGLSPALLRELMTQLGQQPIYRLPVIRSDDAATWVRLALALQVGGRLIGLWLLGRHDPDDLYSPAEVATLQTLARQTALALANIEQAAQLQSLYQANIDREEQERVRMAHFLHDAILNQAAILYMRLDAATVTPQVEEAYEILKEQIHQMISNLRPPSLDLGLGAALEELAGELDQRDETEFMLQLQVSAPELHYPSHIENHIFRIVQQACENALRHANARLIQIFGVLAPDHVDLTVVDDGVGFEVGKPLDMAALLAQKHFGLVHMIERAEHIRADFALESAPGRGTRVRLVWRGQPMRPAELPSQD